MRASPHNIALVKEYAMRVVSVSYKRPNIYWVGNTQFIFSVRRCTEKGTPVLLVQVVYPPRCNATSTDLVLLIDKLHPCKDTAFGNNGRLVRHLPSGMFRLSTRLAIKDPNKRRRKFIQDQRRAEAEEDMQCV